MIRRKPLAPGTKRMRSGRSTGAPTKAEAARIVAAKEGPCMACEVYARRNGQYRRCDAHGCDYHHMKSGNVRRGHLFGVGLCAWHHRMVPSEGYRVTEMRAYFGPSLMDGSRLFRETYGDDNFLISLQNEILNVQD